MHGKDVLSHGMKTWNETVNKGASLVLRRKKCVYLRAAACRSAIPGLELIRPKRRGGDKLPSTGIKAGAMLAVF
jgi:hypothetical protein